MEKGMKVVERLANGFVVAEGPDGRRYGFVSASSAHLFAVARDWNFDPNWLFIGEDS